MPPSKTLIVAFAGNPNVGKTALINACSGSKLKVGNWPGVTVEKREAAFEYQGFHIILVDLPGTYSLSPHSIEEKVGRDFLEKTPPDVIVDVIDTSNLERNLYLTLQLAELDIPMVVALNMWDEFEDRGYTLDKKHLADALGVPLLPTVALTHRGIPELLAAIMQAYQKKTRAQKLFFEPMVEKEVEEVSTAIQGEPYAAKLAPRWYALKLLEEEPYTLDLIEKEYRIPLKDWAMARRKQLEAGLQKGAHAYFTQHKIQFISSLVSQTVRQVNVSKQDFTSHIDKIFLHPFWGIPIFWVILYFVFKLTFDISSPFVDWVDGLINGFVIKWAQIFLQTIHLPPFLVSLITDGVIGGVGLVLTFVPLLMCLYLFLALLEESGYIARAALVMDRFMYALGLHGKAFLPLLVGLGCNVPAVYSSRTLESETDRKMTVAILSFVSCGAKLPIYALFTAVFFQKHQALVILVMYMIGVMVAIGWAFLLRQTVFRQEPPVFIMELPPYRLPNVKWIWASIWVKIRSFMKDAGSVIAITVVMLWCLVNLPYGAPSQDTILARSAKVIAPIFAPQGFGKNWEPVAAIIPGFVAKEVVVGTLGVILNVDAKTAITEQDLGADIKYQVLALKDAVVTAGISTINSLVPTPFSIEQQQRSPVFRALQKKFTPLSAFSYMVFNLLLLSCVAVMGAVVQEFNLKYLGFILLLTTGTAYVVSALVYQGGLILGFS